MCAVIAVVDLLDEDSERCDTITLIKHHHGTTENIAHWIRHALTVEVDGVKQHKVTVKFRKLLPSSKEHELIYRALRNHYRLVKLYNAELEEIGATIEYIEFLPNDGIPDNEDDISKDLGDIWINIPEFKYALVEQLMSTFMKEALNKDGGNQELRILLDKIGLECIDLSIMSKFWGNHRLCYPEEKIILGKGPFGERLIYAKTLIESAYLNGQIGKVRHLCYVVFENWKEQVSLNDIYWVFVYYSLTRKYGSESYTLESKYNNSIMKNNAIKNKYLIVEGDYKNLLDVLLLLQEPCVSDEWIEKYKNHLYECEYANLKDDLATSLLIEGIIGLLWYYDDEKVIWQEVSKVIIEKIKQCNCELARGIEDCCQKLLVQTQVLFDENLVLNEGYTADLPIARAWKNFWDGNWNEIKMDIPDLCEKAEKDRDYLCSVQGFINIVGNVALSEDEMDYTLKAIDISIGRSRYNRIIMEQSLPIYWAQREQQIESLLFKCAENPLGSAESKKQLVQLISLRKMDALKFWNLGEYMDTLRNEVKLYYYIATYVNKYEEYNGSIDYLSRTLIGYIKALDKKILSNEQIKKTCKLLNKHIPDSIDEVVDYIVEKSKKIEWQYVLTIIEELSPYLSQHHKERIIDWILLYDNYYKKQNLYFNAKQYLFIKEWLGDLTESEWKKIATIIEEIFKTENMYITNRELAIEVLKKVPWDMAMMYLSSMNHFSISETNREYIAQAVLEMSDRKDANKEQLHEFIDRCIEKDECEKYQKTNLLIDVETLWELDPVDISKVRGEIEHLKSKLKTIGNLSGRSPKTLYAIKERCFNQNWDAALDDEVISIIQELLNIMKEYQPTLSASYFGDFCVILGEIGRVCSANVRDYINSQVIIMFVDNHFLVNEKKYKDDPFNTFHFYDGTRNLYEKQVMYLLIRGMTVMKDEYIRKSIEWSKRKLSLDEPVLFQYAFVMFSYFYFMGKESESRQKALMGFMYIQGRINGNGEKTEEIKSEIGKAINALKESKNWFGNKNYMELIQEDSVYKEMFDSINEKFD